MAATLLLIAAGVVAAIDWWAVVGERRPIELVAKPVTMALLVAVAATLGDAPGDVRLALVLGAALGVVGDVALLSDAESAFLVGLGSFAVGHISYSIAAMLVGFEPAWALPGLVAVAALLGYRFITRTLPGARAHGGTALGGAVVFYAVVISVMVVSAFATAVVVAAAGATLFAISDWSLGHQRFVSPLPGGRLSVMIPYHVGQALLIVGLATA